MKVSIIGHLKSRRDQLTGAIENTRNRKKSMKHGLACGIIKECAELVRVYH